MSDGSRIEWTEATWNVVSGCTKISPGCDHCYIARTPPFRIADRRFDKPSTGGTTGVLLHGDRLYQPFAWRKPRRIFVCSLADLFHADVPDGFIARVFAAMALNPRHTFQTLTKRPARMRALLSSPAFRSSVADAAYLMATGEDRDTVTRRHVACAAWTSFRGPSDGRLASGLVREVPWPLPNVWVGVSAEDQTRADQRIPILLDTPAAVRWISAEPLLGPVDLRPFLPGDEWSPDAECAKCGEQWWARDKGHEILHRCGRDCPDAASGCDQEGVELGAWCDGPLVSPPTIDWVVLGGESGPGARPMDLTWAEQIVALCQDAGVPVLVKQLGTVTGGRTHHDIDTFPAALRVRDYPTTRERNPIP